MSQVKIKRALLSVSDKTGLIELGQNLNAKNVELIASGGTRKALEEAGLKVTAVESITGNPEAFGGRMKTLSFQISSSLLFRRDHHKDIEESKQLNIEPIDLVVCNLYPFEKVAKDNGAFDQLIENIDIGGPTMVRSAAKNHQYVAILTSPDQYAGFISHFKEKGETNLALRTELALEAFQLTARYEDCIAIHLQEKIKGQNDKRELRYGENPHQKAWVQSTPGISGLASVVPIQGKVLSYNNFLDADAAWKACMNFHQMTNKEKSSVAVVVKHLNPCGAAISSNLNDALKLAWEGDPVSSFGSIIALNGEVDEVCALWLTDRFVEVIIAPSYTQEALHVFRKKKNLRIIQLNLTEREISQNVVRSIDGGMLIQEEDTGIDQEFQSVTQLEYSKEMIPLSQFGIIAAKHLKSNAIVIVDQNDSGMFIAGAGMGNPNRLISLKQAAEKARDNGHRNLESAVLVSDAFFPFSDNIELASEFGIKNIIEPGGSIKDDQVIEAANQKQMRMAFTGRRHFRH